MYVGRGIIRKKLQSGNMFKHQRIFVVSETKSNVTKHLKSCAMPLYHSLVTSATKCYEVTVPKLTEIYRG